MGPPHTKNYTKVGSSEASPSRAPLAVAVAIAVTIATAAVALVETNLQQRVASFVAVVSVVLVVTALKGRRTSATPLANVVVCGVPATVSEPIQVATAVMMSTPPETVLSFTVNGEEQRIVNPSPSLLLVDYLRDTLGLTGTKIGCGEGGCGACTCVAIGADGVPRAINSCLRLLCACDGLAITTVEGFGSQADGFSRVQKAIADGQGSQ